MSIYLGNLSVDDIERRTGIVLNDEHKRYMNEHRLECRERDSR